MPFLADVIEQLNAMGWGLKNVVCEGAYSQFEVDFDYTTVLGMADRFTFLRILLKEIAKRHGLFVTFMPKPAQGDWRSGAHINWSVQSTANPGKNLFKDEAQRRLERHGAMGRRRRAPARRGADRGQLPDGEQLQGPDRPGARIRGRHRDLGADPHHLRRQQPLGHDPRFRRRASPSRTAPSICA